MIPCVCPGCGSKLEAKNRLAGRTRKMSEVRRSGGSARPAAGCPCPMPLPRPPFTTLTPPAFLRCTSRRGWTASNHYVICDPARAVAVWENNGKGWMLKTDAGLASATAQPRATPLGGRFQADRVEVQGVRRRPASGRIGRLPVGPSLGDDESRSQRRPHLDGGHRPRLVESFAEERRPQRDPRAVHARGLGEVARGDGLFQQRRLSLAGRGGITTRGFPAFQCGRTPPAVTHWRFQIARPLHLA